jgi:DNA-binding Lrp family transcriptional regulator
MQLGYILINAEPGCEDRLARDLRKIPELGDVCVVYGVYDIVAKIYADSFEQAKDVIKNKVRNVDKLRSTLTMLAVPDYGGSYRNEKGEIVFDIVPRKKEK